MGHSRRAGRETREVLSLLPGTLRGYIFQHNPEEKNAVLHRQPDRAVCGHILSVGAGVLSAGRFQGENLFVHNDPPVPDHVFLADIGNHTVYVAIVAAAWQVPLVHHVVGSPVRGGHHYHHKHTLSVSTPSCGIFNDSALESSGMAILLLYMLSTGNRARTRYRRGCERCSSGHCRKCY